MNSVVRFVGEVACVGFVIFGGIGVLWVVDKLAPPLLMFLARLGI